METKRYLIGVVILAVSGIGFWEGIPRLNDVMIIRAAERKEQEKIEFPGPWLILKNNVAQFDQNVRLTLIENFLDNKEINRQPSTR